MTLHNRTLPLSFFTLGSAALVGVAVGGLAASLVWKSRQAADEGPPHVRIDDIPDALVVCDGEFSIVSSNLGLQKLLGYPPQVAQGLTLSQLAGEGERQRLKRRLRAVTGPPATLQIECRRVDGEPCATRWHIQRGSAGQTVIAIIPVSVGLTQAQARSVAKLREPLMTLVGTVDELGQRALTPSVKEALRLIARSTDEVTDALDELTDKRVAGPVSTSLRPRPGIGSRRAERTVLVVEDNDVNAVILRRCLTRLGLDSRRAVHGEEALKMLEEPIFDAVLMDCQMPIMDGYEASRRIRATPSIADIPIIAVTAHARKTDGDRCIRAGMDSHLTKPVRIDELRSVLSEWMGPLVSTNSVPPHQALDLETLGQLRALLGDEFESTVRLFLTDAEAALTTAEQAYEAGDWELLGRAAHSLKSSSAYVGATPVSDACTRVVFQARAEKGQQMDRLLRGLRDGLGMVAEALRAELEQTT